MQHYYDDITIKTFCFVDAHLTASNKGKLANQNTAYKIIKLESDLFPIYSCCSIQNYDVTMHVSLARV